MFKTEADNKSRVISVQKLELTEKQIKGLSTGLKCIPSFGKDEGEKYLKTNNRRTTTTLIARLKDYFKT